MSPAEPTLYQLTLAALLVAANVGISLAFGLGMEAGIALAAVRAVVQIGAIGVLLKIVLTQSSPAWTVLAVAVMLGSVAASTGRRGRRFRGWSLEALSYLAPMAVAALATAYVLVVVIAPTPWHASRYVLALVGLVGASALTGAGLALETLTEGARSERGGIEARMALGAHRFAAFQPVLRRTLSAALTPSLTMLSAAGLLALPGVMGGQLLVGVDPVAASKYQIALALVMAGAAGLGALGAALAGVLLLTDARHRLRLDRLARAPWR
jgi:putative ABC transport system permease protein